MGDGIVCPKHQVDSCTEKHPVGYKLVSVLSPDSLVSLGTWIMRHGTKDQVAFVKGQVARL